MYVGKHFKVHKARIGYVKLKKHLKQGTSSETYDKMLKREKSNRAEENQDIGEEKNQKYSFQKKSMDHLGDEEQKFQDIKDQLILLKHQ